MYWVEFATQTLELVLPQVRLQLERLLSDKADLTRSLAEAQRAAKAAEAERTTLAQQLEALTKERADLQAQVGGETGWGWGVMDVNVTASCYQILR
jgi:chromosome segregation ATPase